MSTIVHTLDLVTEWVQKNICDIVSFKVPPDYQKIDDGCERVTLKSKNPDGQGYEYKRITPKAFKWLVPTKDRIPPDIKTAFPSACVRIADGEDALSARSINVEICLSVWNPGIHGSDIIKEVDDGSYILWDGEEAKQYFERNNDGWRENWNWIDLALRTIESAESINGVQFDRNSIKFAPFKSENDMVDFYPFWFAYISFTVKMPIIRNIPEWDGIL